MFRLLPFLILFSFFQIHSQSWNENIKTENPTFFEYQRAFETHWLDKPIERGIGYNVFKRWEWFWEQRVGKEGVFPKSGHNYREWQNFNDANIRRSGDYEGKWKPLGPTQTPGGYWGLGRLNCIAFHPTDKNTFWVGSPSGGVWKTTDYGKNWSTSTDRNPVLGVSSIAVHPVNPDTIYIATGDANRGSLWGMTGGARGDNTSVGILRSTDGGETWHATGLSFENSDEILIKTILINPNQPNILLCSSSSGIYRSENSGETWTRVITSYFMEMAFKPNNPNVVYVTTFVTNSFGNARVVRSLDGGKTFNLVYTVPEGARIALGTTKAEPNLVHILVSHRTGGRFEGVYESTDSGTTFAKICSTPNILANTINGSGTSGQGWYDLTYAISPVNSNRCFVGGVNNWRSSNKGRNFYIRTYWTNNEINIPVVHADKHHFIFHPLENETIFDCNDGGVYYSTDRGLSWTDISEGLNITQFYRFDVASKDTAIIIGGSQDNGTRVYDNGFWREATGGDGMQCAIDPLDNSIMYSSYVYGRLYANFVGFMSGGTIIISNNIPGRPTGAWVTPFKLDEQKSGVIVAGYRDVYKSIDYGNSWTQISTNLNNNQLLRSIALGKKSSNVIYAADYFALYRTFNNGQSWERILTTSAPITMLEVDYDSDSIVYVTHSSYVANTKVTKIDLRESALTQNTNLTANLPNVAVNCVMLDKYKKDALFVGTDIGIFYKENLQADWRPFMEDLPNVVVTELKANFEQNAIFAATFGRGIWKSDLYESFESLSIVKLTPEHLATEVATNTEISIEFSSEIKKGSGDISLFNKDGLFAQIPVDSSIITISQKQLKIELGESLNSSDTFKIELDRGVVLTQNNFPFTGLKQQNWIFSTQLEEEEEENGTSLTQISAYPNPASNEINVVCKSCTEKFKVSIFDMNGKEILTETEVENETNMDVSNIESGVYYISINHQKNRTVKKLIIGLR